MSALLPYILGATLGALFVLSLLVLLPALRSIESAIQLARSGADAQAREHSRILSELQARLRSFDSERDHAQDAQATAHRLILTRQADIIDALEFITARLSEPAPAPAPAPRQAPAAAAAEEKPRAKPGRKPGPKPAPAPDPIPVPEVTEGADIDPNQATLPV